MTEYEADQLQYVIYQLGLNSAAITALHSLLQRRDREVYDYVYTALIPNDRSCLQESEWEAYYRHSDM
jgi:hypothetical protein